MTGQRDIDRTLDAWFVDGPSVMPDRLFDAVLDQVERTPQRRFARLRLRLTEMNPRIGWLAAAAAGLIVVIVALATINRPPDDSIGASSSPIVSPSAPAAAIPAELRSTWMGGPRPLPGLDADGGVTVTFTAGDFTMSQSAGTAATRFVSLAGAPSGNSFQLTTGTNVSDCPEGATGSYTWSISASGQTLEIVAEEDSCAGRLAAVPGTYWRMDCPTAEDNCLGPVDAGTYSSQFFDPFLDPQEPWTPRYGALTYTVPGRWVNVDDWPGSFTLAHDLMPEGTFVTIINDVVVATDAEPCSEDPHPDVGTTADDITGYLIGLGTDGIGGNPLRGTTSLGGLSGYSVQLAIGSDWTQSCPWTEGQPYRNLFTDRQAGEGFSWGILPGERMFLTFLDVTEDRAIMIAYDSLTEEASDMFLNEATTVIESFVFTP